METIPITCDGCHTTHQVTRDSTAPKNAISMGCNWCPICGDQAEDIYDEWYNENDGDGDNEKDIPVDPNQLCMPFIIDEILETSEPIKNPCFVMYIDENDKIIPHEY